MILKQKKAPGQKMIKRLSLQQRSWLNGLGGALLFMIGQCLFALSWVRLYGGYDKPTWIFMIILGLVLTLSGLLVMGQALILSSHIKARRYFKKRHNVLAKRGTDVLKNSKLKTEKKP